MDTREEEKGCSLSLLILRKMLPTAWGRAWKNLLLLSLLMRILLAKVLLKLPFCPLSEFQSVCSRDTEPMVWFLLRNLATWLWISWESGECGDSAVHAHVSSAGKIPRFAGVRSAFVLVRPSTDQMRPAYIMDGNLLLLKVPWFKCYFHPKHSQRNILNNVWPTIWAPSPKSWRVKWTIVSLLGSTEQFQELHRDPAHWVSMGPYVS